MPTSSHSSVQPTSPGHATSSREQETGTITILVADDHRLFRELLVSILQMERDIRVVGEATSGMEAVAKVRLLHPQMVLMDINMPIIDGLAATRQITEEFPDIAVIMLTMYKHNHQILQAMRAGAKGYLLKDVPASEVMAAIRTVHAGGMLIEPSLTGTIVNEYNRLARKVDPANGLNLLTEREIEILRFVAAGMSNREIADKLAYSEKTVKNYLSNIFSKLNIRDRTQAAIYALRNGLIPNEEMGN